MDIACLTCRLGISQALVNTMSGPLWPKGYNFRNIIVKTQEPLHVAYIRICWSPIRFFERILLLEPFVMDWLASFMYLLLKGLKWIEWRRSVQVQEVDDVDKHNRLVKFALVRLVGMGRQTMAC